MKKIFVLCFAAAAVLSAQGAVVRMAGHDAVVTSHRVTPVPVAVREGLAKPCASVVLAAVDAAALLAEDSKKAMTPGPRAKRIGIVRDLSAPVRVDGSSPWMPTSDGGWIFTLQISATGAEAVRVAIDNVSVPDGAQFMVFATHDASDRRGPFSRLDVAAAGPRFWAETVWADDVTLECVLPPGVPPSAASFRVGQIAHGYVAAAKVAKAAQGGAGWCENDVKCYAAWTNDANAIALITLVDGIAMYYCTGCLLADSEPADANIYFMTANHCVGSDKVAGTVEFYWFDTTPSCNGAAPDLNNLPRTSGSDYLAGATYAQMNDFAFLRSHQAPPAGTRLLGWTSATPAGTDTVTALHHPNASWQRISFGNLSGPQDPNFWMVQWYSGVTEDGSSGCPLVNPAREFIGQLYGGESYCWNTAGIDEFGRFDKSYPLIKQWLRPVAPLSLLSIPVKRDYDGDGKADLNLYRPSDSTWFLFKSTAGFQTFKLGFSGAISLVADFDADGKADSAFYHPPSGMWYWFGTTTGYHYTQFGHAAALPVPADYDADGKTDIAVFEPANGMWHIVRSTAGYTNVQFGYSASIPVPADYDGDGRADIAVFDPASSTWYIIRSTAGFTARQFGPLGVTPVPADYDVDGKADIAVFDSAEARWYILRSADGFLDRTLGSPGGIPVPGDYDGDGKADPATYKLSSGLWTTFRSNTGTTNITTFGSSETQPVAARP